MPEDLPDGAGHSDSQRDLLRFLPRYPGETGPPVGTIGRVARFHRCSAESVHVGPDPEAERARQGLTRRIHATSPDVPHAGFDGGSLEARAVGFERSGTGALRLLRTS